MDDQFKKQLTPEEETKQRNHAIVFINISALLQVFNLAIVKRSTTMDASESFPFRVDPMDLCYVRTILLLAASLFFTWQQGHLASILQVLKHEHRKTLFWRCFCGAIAYLAMAYSLQSLPVSIVSILINTTPFWTAFLGFVMLGELVSRFDKICMAGGFVGVIILTLAKEEEDSSKQFSGQTMLTGVFLGLMCSWMFSIVIVSTRRIRDVFPTVILFYYALAALIMYTPIVVYKFYHKSPELISQMEEVGCNPSLPRLFCYNGFQWLLLFGISAFNITAQNLQTLAFQRANSAFISLVQYISVFYSFLFDIMYFNEEFDGLQLVGALVIVGFNLACIAKKATE